MGEKFKAGNALLLIKKKLNFPCARNKEETLFPAICTKRDAVNPTENAGRNLLGL